MVIQSWKIVASAYLCQAAPLACHCSVIPDHCLAAIAVFQSQSCPCSKLYPAMYHWLLLVTAVMLMQARVKREVCKHVNYRNMCGRSPLPCFGTASMICISDQGGPYSSLMDKWEGQVLVFSNACCRYQEVDWRKKDNWGCNGG